MKSPRSGLITAIAMSALVVLPVTDTRLPRTVGPRPTNDPHARYTVDDKEFYLSEEQIGYVRPGFHITVNSITIPDDRRPVADLSFFNDFNQPLDRNGQVTPGTLSVSQVLAWYAPATRHYTSYTTRI